MYSGIKALPQRRTLTSFPDATSFQHHARKSAKPQLPSRQTGPAVTAAASPRTVLLLLELRASGRDLRRSASRW
jgi:hypothetical protein